MARWRNLVASVHTFHCMRVLMPMIVPMVATSRTVMMMVAVSMPVIVPTLLPWGMLMSNRKEQEEIHTQPCACEYEHQPGLHLTFKVLI